MGRQSLILAILGLASALLLPPSLHGEPSSDFFTVDADGRNLEALISGSGDAPRILDLSPDRKRALLPCLPGPTGPCRSLDIATLRGKRVRTLSSGEIGAAMWSPDGKTIAFERVVCTPSCSVVPDAWAVSTTGKRLRRIARAAWLGAWSPDSQRLATVTYEPPVENCLGGRLQIARADGRRSRFITQKGASVCSGSVAWSPSGRYVAYVDDGITSNLFVADLRSRRSRFIGLGSSPQWSPDDRLAFVAPGDDSLHRVLRTSRPDGTDQHISMTKVWDIGPWSPDGRLLLVIRYVFVPDGNWLVLEDWNRAGVRKAVLSVSVESGFYSTRFVGFWWTRDSRHLLFVRNLRMI